MGVLDNLKKGAEEGFKAMQDGVQNFNATEALHKVEGAAAAGIGGVTKAIDGALNRNVEVETDANRDFVMLLSYFTAADGTVSAEEESKIVELANQLDNNAAEWCADLFHECVDQVDKDSAEFGRLSAAKINARRTLDRISATSEEAKLLCWNLIAVANADGITSEESDFIRYVSEQLGLDKAIFEELSAYNDALVELGEAKTALQSSTRSYNEIEPLMAQLLEREQTIVDAAKALVMDK